MSKANAATATNDNVQFIKRDKLVRDAGTQIRAKLDVNHYTDIAEWLNDNEGEYLNERLSNIEPILVYQDIDDEGNSQYYLVDGFHRDAAHETVGANEIRARIVKGDLRAAIYAAIQANTRHGLKRSNKDKRNAVLRLLDDAEWKGFTNTKIAEIAGVTSMTVGNIKKDIKFVEADGTKVGVDGNEHDVSKSTGRPPANPLQEQEIQTETGTVKISKDRFGREIPEKARGAFMAAQRMYTQLSVMKDARKDLKATNEMVKLGGDNMAYSLEHFDAYDDALRTAISVLEGEAMPYAVCVYCKGTDDTCPACNGHHHINKRLYSAAPDELKALDAVTANEIEYWEMKAKEAAEKEAAEQAKAAAKEQAKAEKEAAKAKAAEDKAKAKEQAKAGVTSTGTKAAPKPEAKGKGKAKAPAYNPDVMDMKPANGDAATGDATANAIEGNADVQPDAPVESQAPASDLPF